MNCAGCKKPITDPKYTGVYQGKTYCKACNQKLAVKLTNKLSSTKKK
jgi:hypothetical protein